MSAKSLELKHTIKLIKELTSEIDEIEDSIQQIMDELHPPILSIPGMGVHSAAMILAEIGDFSNFDSPDKVLAYAGCSPSTYQSGKLTNCYETRFSLSAIRSLQRNQVRLPLESRLC